jgi:hypothetical protein
MADAQLDEIRIEDLQRVHLGPGDVLIVRTAHIPSKAATDALHEYLHDVFPANRVLIVSRGTDLSVVTSRIESSVA